MLKNKSLDLSTVKVLDDIFKTKEQEKHKFHQIIEKDKTIILNCYKNLPLYKDSMNQIEKNNKGNFNYNRMVKNSLKNKSNFIKIILRAVKKVNEVKKVEPKKIINVKHNFSAPHIEAVRKRKIQLERRNLLKSYEVEKNDGIENDKTISFLSTGKNVKDSNKSLRGIYVNKGTISADINKNINLTKDKSDLLTSMPVLFNTFLNISKTNNPESCTNGEKKINKYSILLNKCQDEINRGEKIVEKFEDSMNNEKNNLPSIIQNKPKNDINIRKLLRDKIDNNNKYKILEFEKFNELKKSINSKISDNYIFFNRREYSVLIKNKCKNEYDLYLEDINKIKGKLEKKKINEKKKLNKIRNMLEVDFLKKNYLKYKINKYDNNNRYIKIKEDENMKNSYIYNDNYFELDNKKLKENKGNFTSLLLSKIDNVTEDFKN